MQRSFRNMIQNREDLFLFFSQWLSLQVQPSMAQLELQELTFSRGVPENVSLWYWLKLPLQALRGYVYKIHYKQMEVALSLAPNWYEALWTMFTWPQWASASQLACSPSHRSLLSQYPAVSSEPTCWQNIMYRHLLPKKQPPQVPEPRLSPDSHLQHQTFCFPWRWNLAGFPC